MTTNQFIEAMLTSKAVWLLLLIGMLGLTLIVKDLVTWLVKRNGSRSEAGGLKTTLRIFKDITNAISAVSGYFITK